VYEYVTVLPFRLTICLHTQSVHKTWGDGVGVGVFVGVTELVTEGVTELVTDGVTLGVVFDVCDGVGDGVEVTDGVTVGVGETNDESQHSVFENTLLVVTELWIPPIKIYRLALPVKSLLQL